MIVSLDEIKQHLRVEHDEDDDLLTSYICQAQAAAEDYCRVAFEEGAAEPVRLAVLLMASHFYERRDSSDSNAYTTMMAAFHALLYPHRKIEDMF